jgi:predicted enzyme related to lactoylglutathione lyase
VPAQEKQTLPDPQLHAHDRSAGRSSDRAADKFVSRFVWYELMTTDVAAAKAFYAEVVGWGTRDASIPNASIPNMGYSFFTSGAAPLAGLISLPEEVRKTGVQPGWLGYVGVDDVDATVEQVQRLGGAVHVPPTEIPNISRFAVVADPQAAALALFKWLEPDTEQPAELGAPGRVGWHELLAADWEQAWPFYAALFGWQKVEADSGPIGTYQVFAAGGQTIGGMFNKPAMAPIPLWLYYFNVDDIDVATRRVRAGHGEVLIGPVEVPGGKWIVQCTDPQGVIFGLIGKSRHNGIGYFEPVAPRQKRSGV